MIVKLKTMDKSKVNLCEVCKFDVSACKDANPKFGNGKGNDNVYDCDTFRQLQSSQSEAAEFVEWIKETRPIHYNMWTGMIKRLKESKLKLDG